MSKITKWQVGGGLKVFKKKDNFVIYGQHLWYAACLSLSYTGKVEFFYKMGPKILYSRIFKCYNWGISQHYVKTKVSSWLFTKLDDFLQSCSVSKETIDLTITRGTLWSNNLLKSANINMLCQTKVSLW